MAAAVPSTEKAARGITSAPVLDFLKKPKHLLIGGKWVPSKSGKTVETVNPANQEVLALVAEGDIETLTKPLRPPIKGLVPVIREES